MIGLIQGIGAALLGFFLALVATFGFGHEYTLTSPAPEEHTSTTSAPIALETPADAPAEKETKAEPKPVEALAKPAPLPEAPAASAVTPQPPAPQTPQAPVQSPATLNETVRGAVVNILCTSDATSPLNSITASGVIIDPRGVILTNSHVAQYFLLKDYPSPNATNCLIRTGNPAQAKYRAEILFMPPSWIHENAKKIKDETPMGNGNHDYALLYINGTVHQNMPKPESLAHLPISYDLPAIGQRTLIAAYPAGFLGGAIIQKELYQSSALASVQEVFTFVESTIDLFSIGGSVVAQSGSSGGAVANEQGELIGLIVTSTDAPETGGRDLRAISMPYLDRDFEIEAGERLPVYLSKNLQTQAETFQNTVAPNLMQLLLNALGTN